MTFSEYVTLSLVKDGTRWLIDLPVPTVGLGPFPELGTDLGDDS